jgi:hypothetical protein
VTRIKKNSCRLARLPILRDSFLGSHFLTRDSRNRCALPVILQTKSFGRALKQGHIEVFLETQTDIDTHICMSTYSYEHTRTLYFYEHLRNTEPALI